MLEELKEKVYQANLDLDKTRFGYLHMGKCIRHRP